MDIMRVGSPPTSDGGSNSSNSICFFDISGSPIAEPREWEPAVIELPIEPSKLESTKLEFQSGTLPIYAQVLGSQKKVLANWPRSGAGFYLLRLVLNDNPVEPSFLFTIRPRKITSEQFAQLIADLEYELPSEVAVALQRTGALAGIDLLPPSQTTLAAEVMRLRWAIFGRGNRPGLQQILESLASKHHRVIHSVERWVPRRSARRPQPFRLVHSLARGQNIALDRKPLSVLDTNFQHSVDVYENRLVKLYYEQVQRRLRSCLNALKFAGPKNILEDMLATQISLKRARAQARFLNDVSIVSHLPTKVTMVLLKTPSYRAALESYLFFHRSVAVRLQEPALDSPLENLPLLYQYWGTLRVISATLQVGAELGYVNGQQNLVKIGVGRGDAYLQVLPKGHIAVSLEHPTHAVSVRLLIEPLYAKVGRIRSMSYEQRPDVSLEVYDPNGTVSVYLFDPKYKLSRDDSEIEKSDGRPKKEDIDKMHAYRDAIRDEDGRRVVRYASILYPGLKTVSYGPGLEAISSLPGDADELTGHVRSVVYQALRVTN